jgi:hypothetical protein
MFQWMFFWRRVRSPKPEAEPKIEAAPKTGPEVDMPLEQRAGVFVLPVGPSVVPQIPSTSRTKPSVSRNHRIDYFTHGRYGAPDLKTPKLRAPALNSERRGGAIPGTAASDTK